MLRAKFIPYRLNFNFTAITSRQSMTFKDTYLLFVTDTDKPGKTGVGECALFKGLSAEDNSGYEQRLKWLCDNINRVSLDDIEDSSIRFGYETAMWSLHGTSPWHLLDNPWSDNNESININGLVWMGDFDLMMKRIEDVISKGFITVKIKIGGIDFENELDMIKHIRENYSDKNLTIRLDANGSFTPKDALQKLERLARYDIHSLEQPIKAGQWSKMREITKYSAIPIALDEELIGNLNYDKRNYLLDGTQPQFLVLKPSLHGGFATCDGWIEDATQRELGWWSTSALESNIGLNAIAQWVSRKNISLPQGLGTGSLYSNNFESPIKVKNGSLVYEKEAQWDEKSIYKLFDHDS